MREDIDLLVNKAHRALLVNQKSHARGAFIVILRRAIQLAERVLGIGNKRKGEMPLLGESLLALWPPGGIH